MRIWLHAEIVVPPYILEQDDGTTLVSDGTFRYRPWQQFLSRHLPRVFPTCGVFIPLDDEPQRVGGWTVNELRRRAKCA